VHTTGGTYQCKALILAMGAYPRRLDLANEQKLVGRGVSYCATCDGAFFRDKVVAVIGSGNSAVGEALVLSALCKKVYVITRGPRFKGEKSSIETLNKTENITAIHNSKVISLLENEGRVSAIEILDSTTEEAQILDCEGVFVSIGRIPNTKLCDEYIDTDPQGYILSDETTRTNIDGVYAVGDLRTKPLRQIITAASDGSVAAMYAEEYIRNL
jgi:thioredoxin reductase (NADPH)